MKGDLSYYFYSLGNHEAAVQISQILMDKDYTAFMKLYTSPDNDVMYSLPGEAFEDADTEESVERDITDKTWFDRITYFEYEHG